MSEYKVPVYDEDGAIIARVKYNSNLDFWDGRNHTSGQTGRHLGYTKLSKSGKYVLIHGSQWQGETDYGRVVSPIELIREALRTNNFDALIEEYPELKEVADNEIEQEESEVVRFDKVVTAHGNGAHVSVPKEYLDKVAHITIVLD